MITANLLDFPPNLGIFIRIFKKTIYVTSLAFRMFKHRHRTAGNDDIEGDGDGSDVKHDDDGVVDVGKGTWIQ